MTQYGNKTQYQYYWNSTGTFNSTMPASDSSQNIITPPAYVSFGKFYYSNFHKTYIAILDVNSQGWVSYSTTGQPQGPWSAPTFAFNIYTDSGCNQYGNGNEDLIPYYLTAHPGWYGTSGNQLLIGWAQCTAYVTMTTINFAAVH